MPRNRLARQTASKPYRPRRLSLEHLEDRSVPSTFTVNTTLDDVTPANGKFSLREAITKANTTPGADTIIVPAGVFKIIIAGAGEVANATGDFNITDAVTIAGAGAGATIIDAQQKDRVFDVFGSGPSSIKVVLQGLTIRNGLATGGAVDGTGGAVRVGMADLVVRDCAVVGNRASWTGGGISNDTLPGSGNVKVVRTTVARNVSGQSGGGLFAIDSSLLTITDSTIRRNVAAGRGGGIFSSTPTLTNCAISSNSAAGNGGGIFSLTPTLTNCAISGNTAAADGGGIFANTATLTGCTISGNTAVIIGGGIFANTATLSNSTISGNSAADSAGGVNAGTTATLTRCTISGNHAGGSGGGIWLGGTATLTSCTISGNSAANNGGGINGASAAALTNCTISGNSAGGSGGGMFAISATLVNCTIAENLAPTGGGLVSGGGGTIFIRNSIFALNLTEFNGSGPDVSGAFTSQGHNLIGDGTGSTGFTNGTNGDIVGTADIPIDPKLGPLANNGGPTQTMALQAGSPAIDKGDNAGVLLVATDQRGLSRKKDGNFDGVAVVDIGAFER